MAKNPNTLQSAHPSVADMTVYGLAAQEEAEELSDEQGYTDGLAYRTLAYFREGRAVTLLLLSGVYLVLALSLNGAGWTGAVGMDLLVFVVLGAVLMGALMAFSRFDGFFMLSHSFATGLAWVFYLMTFLVRDEKRVELFIENGIPALQARAYFLLERWLEWTEAALSRQASNDNFVFVFEISFLVWWLTYLGVWSVFRHGHVWRGVVMAGVALLVNTYYAPSPVMGFLVAYCIVALLLLAWTNLIDHRQRWRAFRIYFSQDIGFDFMRTGFVYTIAVIGLAFVAPNMGRNVTFYDMMRPVNQRWEAATQEWNRLYQGLNRQSRAVQSVFGRTLTLSGERNVTDRPILEVASTEGRYWRAVTFDHFTGRQWINTADDEVTYRANERIPAILWTSREPVTQTVTLLAPTGNVVFAAPDVVQANIPLAGFAQPVVNVGFGTQEQAGNELTWTRARVTLDVGDTYEVISNYTSVTERELREVEANYPPEILERYLQLPDDFSPRVAELAEEVMANQDTVYDKAKTLERFLRGIEYDDGIPAPPQNVDPLEYFLFDIQRGYCDYYASAMGAMLRSQGIPARLASGYAEGTYDRETDSYIITERDAHTWVEVYFPEFGWIEFEPTAGESILDRPSGAELRDSGLVPGMDEDSLAEDEFLMDDSLNPIGDLPGDMEDPIGGIAALPGRSPIVGTGLLLTVLALAGGVWLMRRRMYQGPKAFVQEPQIFYDRLTNWTDRLRLALRPALTPYERSALLAEQIPQGSAFIARITEIYVQFRYAPGSGQMAAETQQDLNSNWRQLRSVLWRTWLRQKFQLKK